ncbi:MAG: NADP-dependent isocitrate dehydrogenase, partial [Bacteroidetes bacterium]|nr:NADP-dependent isocitrate dehydrogenase [Bacteroidota bacterium]
GDLAKQEGTTIIKLPNISASMSQLKAAIKELQEKGIPVPDYPDTPSTDREKDHKSRYDKIKGSAVNPVLREGNSDRRAPKAVKNFARNNPHRMGKWSATSATRIKTMVSGDFKHTEQSLTIDRDRKVSIVLKTTDQREIVLKSSLSLTDKEIIDVSAMQKHALQSFFKTAYSEAKSENLLLSLHLKATMMKVSDPIIFGHALSAYFNDLFAAHGTVVKEVNINLNEGLQSVLNNLEASESDGALKLRTAILEKLADSADWAMVNSDKGITNLHVPSDVIIDASMPAMIRNSGKMHDASGTLRDTLAIIPDSSYAAVYQTTIDFCKKFGAFDPSTMGTVPNVGLMAQKAEEYGSHDKTFEIASAGTVVVVDEVTQEILIENEVQPGDIWRMCQVKDPAIKNWVSLAVERARLSQTPAIFWLDEHRAHDAELIKKVNAYLAQENTKGLDIRILSVADATYETLKRLKEGKDTISVTGNVLRDYLTDLFPILEVGTSAKMLSIVPLMNGGGLFETGAGGSAPKHVQQFLEEGHLRWDSLGEFLALEVALEFIAQKTNNDDLMIYADTLGDAVERLLNENLGPQRDIGTIDTRGSHFYLIKFWVEALSVSGISATQKQRFSHLSSALINHSETILAEINQTQGHPQNVGGYYAPKAALANQAMRPSVTLNQLIENY